LYANEKLVDGPPQTPGQPVSEHQPGDRPQPADGEDAPGHPVQRPTVVAFGFHQPVAIEFPQILDGGEHFLAEELG
jgi:hypothetical protein